MIDNEKLLIVMCEDKKIADIYYDFENRKVKVINYENNIFRRVFIKDEPTWEDFRKFLESRCVIKDRVNFKEILELLGLSKFDPWLYVKKTRGIILRDFIWLRFGNADVEVWENVRQNDYVVDEKYIESLVDCI